MKPCINITLKKADVLIKAATGTATLACKSGCGQCCRIFPISVSLAEAKTMLDHYRRHTAKHIYKKWLKHTRKEARKLTHITTVEKYRQSVSQCPFLQNNRCAVYSVRPVVCRQSVSTSVDYCQPNPPPESIADHPMHARIHNAVQSLQNDPTTPGEYQRSLMLIQNAINAVSRGVEWQSGEIIMDDFCRANT